MDYQIRWTRRAEANLHTVVNYLNEKWGERSAIKFVKRVNKFLETVTQRPLIGKMEIKESHLRSFVLSKHNTLFYRVKNRQIILIAFFDNRQHPAKRIS